jgi:endonuclease III
LGGKVEREKAILQLEKLKNHESIKDMRLTAESWDAPWKTLISILLSARTRDEVTIAVSTKLFEKYDRVEKLARAKKEDIEKAIRSINFYRNKTKSVLACARTLVEDYDGKVPMDIDELVKLHGVGRKTANVFLAEYGGDTIGVDTHVSYISQRLGWTPNKDPAKIEKDLEVLFPRKYWKNMNSVLVRFGKTHTSKKEKDRILDYIRENV